MKIIDVEQNSDEWMQARLGIPTASSASKLITSKGEPTTGKGLTDYAKTLAADKFAGKQIDHWQGNEYTDRGHEVEAEALSWYTLEHNVDLTQIGFCTDDNGSYGASPDALVGDDGLVEIKCLPKGHMDAILYWAKNKRPPTPYLAQVHMQLLVTDRNYCDLTYYHRDLPKIIMRVERDKAMDEALLAQIEQCTNLRNEFFNELTKLESVA